MNIHAIGYHPDGLAIGCFSYILLICLLTKDVI